jgi:TolB-like protein/DNA-binding winged helix-turn-helix (wHTH) protein/Flp pilus assembly protein TadD
LKVVKKSVKKGEKPGSISMKDRVGFATGYLYRFGPFEIDPQRRTLSYNESPVPLTPKAFDVLLFLAQNPNRLITKEELLQAVWGDTFVEEGNLKQYISHLRKALADNSEDNRLIVTITRKGYQFTADVVLAEAADIPKRNAAQVVTSGASTPGIAVDAKAGNENSRTQALTVLESSKVSAVIPRPWSRWRIAAVLGAAAVVLLAAGYISWRFRAAPPRSEKIMLAVLPFQNLTGDPKEEYLADGLTEEMIAQLSRLHPEQLGVIARTSVMGYKHSDQRLDQIGRDLSVQYVLENSLRGNGDRLRITVQLLQVKDQSHVWAQDFDYRHRDILSLEDDVAKAVVREIQIRLTPQQQADLTRLRPINAEAFDAYMEGRYFLNRDNDGDLNRAVSYYEQAIKLDSNYAPAWVGLSRARFRQADRGFIPHEEGQRQAREAAEQALALDPSLPEAHALIGQIKRLVDWDWTGANASLQRALTLDPGNPAVLFDASTLAGSLGHFDEALELVRRSIALDPLNAATRESLAQVCWAMGRQDEAEANFKKALELNPGLPGDHESLGLVYLVQGRVQAALVEIEREPMALLRLQGQAVAYYALGRKKESDTALSEFIAKYQTSAAFQIADVYAFRREPDQAFEWLERAYMQHDGGVASIKWDPLLENLRGDPRYIAFLKKLRLPL